MVRQWRLLAGDVLPCYFSAFYSPARKVALRRLPETSWLQFNCATTYSEPVDWRFKSKASSSKDPRIFLSGHITREYIDRISIVSKTHGEYHLLLPRVEMSDAGTYTCHDRAGLHGEKSAGAQLVVILEGVPDCRTNINFNDVIGENACGIPPDTLQVTCSVLYQGFLRPTLTIRLDGDPCVSETLYNSGIHSEQEIQKTVTLTANTVKDGSSFTCNIGLGEDVDDAKYRWNSHMIQKVVAGTEKPTSHSCNKTEILCSSISSSLSCSYKWVDSKNQTVVTDHKLVLTDTLRHSPGGFKCLASCRLKNTICKDIVLDLVTCGPKLEDGDEHSWRGMTIDIVVKVAASVLGFVVALFIVLLLLIVYCLKHNQTGRESRGDGHGGASAEKVSLVPDESIATNSSQTPSTGSSTENVKHDGDGTAELTDVITLTKDPDVIGTLRRRQVRKGKNKDSSQSGIVRDTIQSLPGELQSDVTAPSDSTATEVTTPSGRRPGSHDDSNSTESDDDIDEDSKPVRKKTICNDAVKSDDSRSDDDDPDDDDDRDGGRVPSFPLQDPDDDDDDDDEDGGCVICPPSPDPVVLMDRLPDEANEMFFMKAAIQVYLTKCKTSSHPEADVFHTLAVSSSCLRMFTQRRFSRKLNKLLSRVYNPYRRRIRFIEDNNVSVDDGAIEEAGQLSEKSGVTGVSKLLDKVYVTVHNSSVIHIYDAFTFTELESVKAKDLVSPWDMAACSKYLQIYVTDFESHHVWSMTEKQDQRILIKDIFNPRGISVTNEGHIVVISWDVVIDKSMLYVLNITGNALKEIVLPESVTMPHHAFATNDNWTFVVCHGCNDRNDSIAGVCIVSDQGVVLCTYENLGKKSNKVRAPVKYEIDDEDDDLSPNPLVTQIPLDDEDLPLVPVFQMDQPDEETTESLASPYAVSVDSHGRIFVADYGHNRILLLDQDLKLKRILLTNTEHRIKQPRQVWLDEPSGNLFVGQDVNNVRVFKVYAKTK